jgi:superfamily II DNA or RNA helicase
MSVFVDLSKCSQELRERMDSELNLVIPINPKQSMSLQPYRIQESFVYIPFAYGVQLGFEPLAHSSLSQSVVFTGKLREEQKVVRDQVLQVLNQTRSVIVSTHVGFGKSILATYFAYKIQMKTLIVVNRIVLMNQWVDVLNRFIYQPRVCIIKPNEIIDWDCDFFIVNAVNLPKIGYMPEIGVVIVDELHLIVSKVLSTCFQYLTPSYFIGLSATPYRNDGLDVLIDLYFGKERIDRQLHRAHHVYKINTGFVPVVHKQANGKVDWNDILNQQSTDVKRNDLIVQIVTQNIYNFLVLCKRVEQIRTLEKRFVELGLNVVALYGNKQPPVVDPEQRIILIGTIQKVGTGFDAPYLNALIVASDLEAYFIQYLGRVFRKQETVPVIFDLVDDYSILKKHYKTREETYLKHGGMIKTRK